LLSWSIGFFASAVRLVHLGRSFKSAGFLFAKSLAGSVAQIKSASMARSLFGYIRLSIRQDDFQSVVGL
jgi:hypothetical protein